MAILIYKDDNDNDDNDNRNKNTTDIDNDNDPYLQLCDSCRVHKNSQDGYWG